MIELLRRLPKLPLRRRQRTKPLRIRQLLTKLQLTRQRQLKLRPQRQQPRRQQRTERPLTPRLPSWFPKLLSRRRRRHKVTAIRTTLVAFPLHPTSIALAAKATARHTYEAL